MSKIAQPDVSVSRSRSGDLEAKLWPNGEIAVWRQRRLKENIYKKGRLSSDALDERPLVPVEQTESMDSGAQRLGLVNVRNFDRPMAGRPRIGLKGITSKGKRMVRNACYLLERDVDKRFLTFATVTLPPLPETQLRELHQKWHKVIDAYRREIRRELRRSGLSGELVGVTEIQPKRYASTGYPILHGHFVWVGRNRGCDWAIKPATHDSIWARAIAVALPNTDIDVSKACKMLPVKGSTESYLSKYMSKGGESISEVLRDGFEDWMPKQWWSLTRSLSKRIRREIRIFHHGIGWLLDTMEEDSQLMWRYKKDILIQNKDSTLIWVATVARLTARANSVVREALAIKPLTSVT